MAYTVKDNVLLFNGRPVAQKPTPNLGGVMKPRLLVMHYTATFNAAGAIAALTSRRAKVSAHLVLDRDGTFTQLAPLNRVCWHAGESQWKGKSGCNGFSIGVEMVNCGPVKERADGKLFPEIAPGKIMSRADCEKARHPNGEPTPYWQIYPEAQVAAAVGAAQAILAYYGFEDIAGHYDIAPDRKRDPGPAWPMATFKGRVHGRADTHAPPLLAAASRDTVAQGDRGEDVKFLQTRLGIDADGKFGPATRRAVVAFQKAQGLAADGVVGPMTWRVLLSQKAAA